jgi:hypothetical protein
VSSNCTNNLHVHTKVYTRERTITLHSPSIMQHTSQHFTPNYYFRCNSNSCYLFGRDIGQIGTHTSLPHIGCRVNRSPIRVITPLCLNKERGILVACWRFCYSPEHARATNMLHLLCLNTDCWALGMNPQISRVKMQFGNARLYSALKSRGEGNLSQSCFRCLYFYFLTLTLLV